MNITTLKRDRVADAMNILRAAKMLAVAEFEYDRAIKDADAFRTEFGMNFRPACDCGSKRTKDDSADAHAQGCAILIKDAASEHERAFRYLDALNVLIRDFTNNHA